MCGFDLDSDCYFQLVSCFNFIMLLTQSLSPATSNIPLSSPERNGSGTVSPSGLQPRSLVSPSSKLDSIKAWSINTYKCTKQIISERLGKSSRTVDSELESQIEALKETQKKYANILRLARALSSHFHNVVQTQRALGDAFSELSQKSPELQDEFSYNAETQKALWKNGEVLMGMIIAVTVVPILTRVDCR